MQAAYNKFLWIKTNHSRASVQPPHMEEASHLSSLDKAPLVPCRCSSYKASTDERWTNVQESNFRSQKSLSGVIFVNFWEWEGPLYGVRGPVIDFVQLSMYASYPWICLMHLQLGHVFFSFILLDSRWVIHSFLLHETQELYDRAAPWKCACAKKIVFTVSFGPEIEYHQAYSQYLNV